MNGDKPNIYWVSESCMFEDHSSACEHDEVGPWGFLIDTHQYNMLSDKYAEAADKYDKEVDKNIKLRLELDQVRADFQSLKEGKE